MQNDLESVVKAILNFTKLFYVSGGTGNVPYYLQDVSVSLEADCDTRSTTVLCTKGGEKGPYEVRMLSFVIVYLHKEP